MNNAAGLEHGEGGEVSAPPKKFMKEISDPKISVFEVLVGGFHPVLYAGRLKSKFPYFFSPRFVNRSM